MGTRFSPTANTTARASTGLWAVFPCAQTHALPSSGAQTQSWLRWQGSAASSGFVMTPRKSGRHLHATSPLQVWWEWGGPLLCHRASEVRVSTTKVPACTARPGRRLVFVGTRHRDSRTACSEGQDMQTPVACLKSPAATWDSSNTPLWQSPLWRTHPLALWRCHKSFLLSLFFYFIFQSGPSGKQNGLSLIFSWIILL